MFSQLETTVILFETMHARVTISLAYRLANGSYCFGVGVRDQVVSDYGAIGSSNEEAASNIRV